MIGLVLAAAGSGSRFQSSVPKQFYLWRGKPLYLYSLQVFEPIISRAVVVVPPDWMEPVREHLQQLSYRNKLCLEAGGEHRQDSVYRGLQKLEGEPELILVHDAARPYVSAEVVRRVVEGTRRHGACVPVIPVPDTVKVVGEGRIEKTLDRSRLRLVQTPQGFHTPLLRQALDRAFQEGFYGTDEAVLVERIGHPVFVVEGDPRNRKVTWTADLDPEGECRVHS